MSLNQLISKVLPRFPHVNPDNEATVLQEVPVETLYLALKDADPEMALWFYENATPEQVQGLMDLDCWTGSEFQPLRFYEYFKNMISVEPPKLAEYMRHIDPEVLILGLMHYLEVDDFDHQNPPDREEKDFILTMDSKYALLFKETAKADPNMREMLFQWINKLSAADIENLRRHLESMKWEQYADLEEYGYSVKKGRLEDMGFIDRHEALAIYSVGIAADFKRYMQSEPLPEGAKRQSIPVRSNYEDDVEAIPTSTFLPEPLAKSLNESGFLAEALAQVTHPGLKQILIGEMVRTINVSLCADDLLHASVEEIGEAAMRARKYIDMGLAYLSDGARELLPQLVENHRLENLFHLGWLAVQDLAKAAAEVLKTHRATYFGKIDGEILESVTRAKTLRHLNLPFDASRDLEIEGTRVVSVEGLLKLGSRIATLAQLARFFDEQLAKALHLKDIPLSEGENYYSRMMAGILRQACGKDYDASPISREEWKSLQTIYVEQKLKDKLTKAATLVAQQMPAAIQAHFERRVRELIADLDFALTHSTSAPAKQFAHMVSMKE